MTPGKVSQAVRKVMTEDKGKLTRAENGAVAAGLTDLWDTLRSLK